MTTGPGIRYYVVVLAIILSGCVNLEAPPDPTRYFLLNGSGDAEQLSRNPAPNAPTIRLDPIEVDAYLDTPYMIIRVGAHEVQFSDINRWGEMLTENIWRVLAVDLMATGKVSEVLQTVGTEADFVVEVQVHRFEGKPPDVAHLSARWRLLDNDGRVLFSSWHDDYNGGWTYGDYAHLAEKLDESLQALADAIADRLPG